MTCRSEIGWLLRLLVVAGLVWTLPASAAEPVSESTQRARAEFIAATDHVKNARWGEALAAFERSAELRPHPLTTFNIGACERALGRYTRAKATLGAALSANTKGELASSFTRDAQEWIREIDALLVRVDVSLSPTDAALLVDGAPLTAGANGEYIVGVERGASATTTPSSPHDAKSPPTTAAPLPKGHGVLVLDPGVHIFSLNRAGFASVVMTKTFAPNTRSSLTLDMQSLPATLRISADRPGSVVTVNELDVGVAPIQITRPAGIYALTVRKVGYVTYQSKVKVGPGEEPTIQATLPEEKPPVTKKVWFWSAVLGLAAGAAVATYFIVRPEPERPAPNGGALGWVVTVPAGK